MVDLCPNETKPNRRRTSSYLTYILNGLLVLFHLVEGSRAVGSSQCKCFTLQQHRVAGRVPEHLYMVGKSLSEHLHKVGGKVPEH
jgi:hypothetical protein